MTQYGYDAAYYAYNAAPNNSYDPLQASPSRVSKRTPIACLFCRGRKLKCDGLAVCANCERRNLACVYAPVGATTGRQ